MVHGKLNAAERETLYHFGSHIQPFGQGCLFLGRQVAEHVVDLSAAGEVVADAEAEACIFLCAQRSGNVLQTVVTGVTSFSFQA